MISGAMIGTGVGLLNRKSSVAPTFDAAAYGTPYFWYDPDDSATQTAVSGKLSQWNDKSGKGGTSKNLVQGTAGNRFTITTRNGYTAFQSSLAANTFMGTVNGAISNLRELTLFMVVSGLTSGSDAGGLFNLPANTGNDYDSERLEIEITSTGLKAYSAMSPPLILEDAFPDSSQWSIITLQMTGSGLTGLLQVDNNASAIGVYGGVTMVSTKLGIGTRFLDSAWGSVGVDCFYRHIVGYDSVLSAGNVSAAKTALAATVGRSL